MSIVNPILPCLPCPSTPISLIVCSACFSAIEGKSEKKGLVDLLMQRPKALFLYPPLRVSQHLAEPDSMPFYDRACTLTCWGSRTRELSGCPQCTPVQAEGKQMTACKTGHCTSPQSFLIHTALPIGSQSMWQAETHPPPVGDVPLHAGTWRKQGPVCSKVKMQFSP